MHVSSEDGRWFFSDNGQLCRKEANHWPNWFGRSKQITRQTQTSLQQDSHASLELPKS